MTLRTATRRAFLYPAVAAAASDWWLSGGINAANAIAVYQPKGAASLAASYTNLANPGLYDAAPGTAPTFATGTGWSFNGSTQYLTIGFAPSVGMSVFVQFSNASGTGSTLGCVQTGYTSFMRLMPRDGSPASRVRYMNGTDLLVTPEMTAGNIGFAGNNAYRNGVSDGTMTGAASPPTFNIFIGGANIFNTGIGYAYTGDIQAVAIYDTTLTSDQVAAVSTAMAAL